MAKKTALPASILLFIKGGHYFVFWQSVCFIFGKGRPMYLLHVHDGFTESVQRLSAVIAVLIALYFFAAYRKYTAEIKRNERLDHFLND